MKKIVFRVDASINIGTGHVMRCLVLARALKERDCDVRFACLPQSGDMIHYINKEGFSVIPLTKVENAIIPSHSADYHAWLQRSESEDALDFLAHVNHADIVIIDHYGINADWEEKVKSSINCKILTIDDLARKHFSDILLDQNLWPNMQKRYAECKGIQLLGPDYALLRPVFSRLKDMKIQKKNQIIVFFGGVDPTNECGKLITAINTISNINYNIIIIKGLLNKRIYKLNNHQSKISMHSYVTKMPNLMKQSKYMIGASGITNWERYCLELPFSVVAVANNQIDISMYLSYLKKLRYLGSGDETKPSTYMNELEFLNDSIDDIKINGINVDGLGARRVCNILMEI